jgi:hypothetical protein
MWMGLMSPLSALYARGSEVPNAVSFKILGASLGLLGPLVGQILAPLAPDIGLLFEDVRVFGSANVATFLHTISFSLEKASTTMSNSFVP